MDDTTRTLIAAFGRFLLTIAEAGEEGQAEPVEGAAIPVDGAVEGAVEAQEPAGRAKKVYRGKPCTCVKCGAGFTAKSTNAKYCPTCKAKVKEENLKRFRSMWNVSMKGAPAPADEGLQADTRPPAWKDDADMVYGNSIEL